MTTTPRAVLRYGRRSVTVLCPLGHLLTQVSLDPRTFAGSMDEAELGAHAHGQPNRFDRLAARCAGYGHTTTHHHTREAR